MSINQFVRQTESVLEEYRIGDGAQSWIEAPSYIPEIGSAEDLHVVLDNQELLDENNPIFVLSNKWKTIRLKKEFEDRQWEIQNLIEEYPIIYYEPPELFRYKMPRTLPKYARSSSVSLGRKFNTRIRNGNVQEALDLVPEFYQPFIRHQLQSVCENIVDDGGELPEEAVGQDKKITDAWRSEDVRDGVFDHFMTIARDAGKFSRSYVIPPANPIMESGNERDLDMMDGVNKWMHTACRELRENPSLTNFEDTPTEATYSYYHIYADAGILRPNTNIDEAIRDHLQDALSNYSYAGVALTISRYPNIWNSNDISVSSLEEFVTDIVNTARQNSVPVILPRSKWYGEYLTDLGIHGFGSMFKTGLRLSDGGGGDPKYRWGKLPIIDQAREVDVEELGEYIDENEELPNVDGMRGIPPGYDPSANDLKQKWGPAKRFRIETSKPWRLAVHNEEVNRLKDAKRNGLHSPAKRYLEDSDHPVIGNGSP